MHADGNISYANYHFEVQVIECLNVNGFGEETYGDWFVPPPSGSEGGVETVTFVKEAPSTDKYAGEADIADLALPPGPTEAMYARHSEDFS